MDQFALLGSVAYRLHMELRNTFFILLPVFFMISVVAVWIQNPTGGPEFIDKIKRAFVATLLLVGFAEISDIILFLTNGIADKIDNMGGLDSFMKMASEKAHSYTLSPLTSILAFDDLIIASLTYLSYFVVYCARFIMVAIYHFSWIFLTIMAPILLLFHLFSSQITLNLFRSLIEIASWRIVWSVLSIILKSLPFGQWYMIEGGHLTIAVLNFVVAICMVGTPLVVRSLVGSGWSAMASGLTGVTAGVMLAAPAKVMAVASAGRSVLSTAMSFGQGLNSKLGQSGMGFGGFSSPTPPPPPRDVTPITANIAHSSRPITLPPPPPPRRT
jgi:hypothetical protein